MKTIFLLLAMLSFFGFHKVIEDPPEDVGCVQVDFIEMPVTAAPILFGKINEPFAWLDDVPIPKNLEGNYPLPRIVTKSNTLRDKTVSNYPLSFGLSRIKCLLRSENYEPPNGVI